MQPEWSSSSSSSTSIKLRTLFLNLFTGISKKKKVITDIPKKKKLIKNSLYRLLRCLSRAKSITKDISKVNKKRLFKMMFYPPKSSINHHNVFVGSFHVAVSFSRKDENHHDDGSFEWLEERVDENNNINEDHSVGDNDIDRMADIFIARCHERFLLEKVESYRRFQDMLARSL